MALILASQSPRRRELLELLRCPFTVRTAEVDEHTDPGADPKEEVARLSRLKALAVARENEDVVIAADTVVVLDGQILGKPADKAHAQQMLRALSGREHQVMTGLTVLRGEKSATVTEISRVFFRQLTDRQIQSYIATGEPMDKAGSYAIQGGGALFAHRLEGDYFNVVGLPLCRLYTLLQQLAPELLDG